MLTTYILLPGISLACNDNYPVMSTRKDNGKEIGLFISLQQIKATQKWSPSSGEPPLSISKAYLIAKEWARNHFTRYDDARVKEITLREYRCSLVSNHWYYFFEINPVIEGNELYGSGNWLAVLMDGTTIGTREY